MKFYGVFFILFAVLILSTSANEKTAEEICRQPKFAGGCRASIPQFYYNVATGECEKYLYGGCDKNDNSFGTKEDCEAKCKGVKPAEK